MCVLKKILNSVSLVNYSVFLVLPGVQDKYVIKKLSPLSYQCNWLLKKPGYRFYFLWPNSMKNGKYPVEW